VDGWRIGPLILAVLLATLALLAISRQTHSHDSWISRGELRNVAGEWCCGEGDCFEIPKRHVKETRNGYRLLLSKSGKPLDPFRPFAPVVSAVPFSRAPAEDPGLRVETVPFAETQPSPDGAYWRCKRPDGSRRCFFAPMPSS
jgi:hypothetical protein